MTNSAPLTFFFFNFEKIENISKNKLKTHDFVCRVCVVCDRALCAPGCHVRPGILALGCCVGCCWERQ